MKYYPKVYQVVGKLIFKDSNILENYSSGTIFANENSAEAYKTHILSKEPNCILEIKELNFYV